MKAKIKNIVDWCVVAGVLTLIFWAVGAIIILKLY